jgi:hypothetical protein
VLAQVIKAHLPEIIGITAGFIVAGSMSAFLAATRDPRPCTMDAT